MSTTARAALLSRAIVNVLRARGFGRMPLATHYTRRAMRLAKAACRWHPSLIEG